MKNGDRPKLRTKHEEDVWTPRWSLRGGAKTKEYVEQRNGGYYVAGKRMSLDSIVYAFQRGESPESTTRSFPVLTLEEVQGALTFYLADKDLIDEYLKREEAEYEKQREQRRAANPELHRKIQEAIRERGMKGSTG